MTENTGKDPKTRKFVAGNRFWEARSSHGPNPIYDTPEQLWAACVQYFEWVEDNPLREAKPFAFQGEVTMANVSKMRAMTLHGLCAFIGISRSLWNQWRQTRPDLLEVITRVDDVIFQQKFEGASADLLNPNIIARDLGLADKKDLSSNDGSMSPKPITVNMTPQEAAEAYARAINPESE